MCFSFSSSKLVDRPFDWAYQLEDLGYSGWEIVHEGRQRLTPENSKLAAAYIENGRPREWFEDTLSNIQPLSDYEIEILSVLRERQISLPLIRSRA